MAENVAAPNYDDYLTWVTTTPAPEDEVQFFKSIAWTRSLVEDPLFKPIPTPTLFTITGQSHNAFIAKTIRTPEGISHWLMLMRKDFETPSDSHKGSGGVSSRPNNVEVRPTKQSDFIILMELGADLDGFGGRVHGGAVCTILDEALSLCVEYHRQRSSDSRAPLYTAQLNTTFRGSVPSPSVVIVKTWLEAKVGRKWFVKGQICDAQDNLLAQGEGLWLTEKESSI
ncbi:hypothetical protein H2200_005907 [Cladophialophora chaetospira]|uniref:Thioesterase domain-containing protein n=1 Tax=Cladophialophora chaetospira TaxID=386627 RepID=A0AA38XAI0_9EURO|nr:hypothetical protein H2200_005907 [Cladophialophora chaetospira]